jgi:hypothetical protein
VLVIILPGIFAWWLTRKSSGKKVILTFTAIYGIYLISAFNLYKINDDFNIAAWVFYKKKNFIEIGNEHNASMVSLPDFECSGTSILMHAPKAFSNVMFRPFLTDSNNNPLILLAALENLMLLLMFILFIVSFRIKVKKLDGLIALSMLYIALIFVLIGLITPVLGAIVRYKIVAMPCLVFLLVYFYDREKLISRIPFFKLLFRKRSS